MNFLTLRKGSTLSCTRKHARSYLSFVTLFRGDPCAPSGSPPSVSTKVGLAPGHWSFAFEDRASNAERPTAKRFAMIRRITVDNKPETSKTENHAGVIDVVAHDPKTGEVVLVMNEPNEWGGSDEQLLALQERFNVYVSFLLDGELAEAHPELAGKPVRIELRCAHMPETRALELLGLIHDQLAFQEIKLEVIVREASIQSDKLRL